MRYQAVIFDLFGTLVNIFSRQQYESALAEMVDILQAPYKEFEKVWYRTGKSRTVGEFRTIEENLEYISRELKVNYSPSQIQCACRVRMEFVARALTPKPDAMATLTRLKSGGYKIGLISNCSTEPPVLWPDTPFAPYFDAAIFSSTCGLQKPDPRIFKLAMERLSVKPEACLYVGDGDGHELTGALNVGLHPVLIINPGEERDSAMRINYEGDSWDGAVITSLREVLDLL
jgi:putative hydrolase of the HAD superfamily